MKKTLILITALLLILTAFAGCSAKPGVSSTSSAEIQPQSLVSAVSSIPSVTSTPSSVASEPSKTSSVPVSSKTSSAVTSSKVTSLKTSSAASSQEPAITTGSTDLFDYEVRSVGIIITKYKGTKTDVTVPAVIDSKTVIAVGANVFTGTAVVTVSLENGISSIGDKAFSGCSALEFVSIPATVAAISLSSFDGSPKARIAAPSGSAAAIFAANAGITAAYPYDVDNGTYQFEVYDNYAVILSCKSNEPEITVPATLYGKTVTVINTKAFVNLTSLIKITLPANLTALLPQAFVGCTALQTVVFPASVISIGEKAFDNCPNVKFDAPENSFAADYALQYLPATFVRSGSGSGFNYNVYTNQVKITAYTGTSAVVTIPNSLENLPVTGIESKAFLNNITISSVTMSDKIFSIGSEAFSGCTALTSIHLSNGISEISERLFNNCTSLVTVNIPSKITSVGNYAFCRCAIANIMLPSTVKHIGDSAFYECTKLATISLGDGVTDIGNYAFYNCSSLASITLPRSMQSLGLDAFTGCTILRIYAYTGSTIAAILTSASIPFTALT